MSEFENEHTPIVSSSHLANSRVPELSEMEYALNLSFNGFQRWIVRGMAAAGYGEMSPLEVQILHVVVHRGKAKRMADIALMLNLEDIHTVSYALKKLEKGGFLKSGKSGKEKVVEATPHGERVCETYREIRERCLISALETLNLDRQDLSRLSGLLRALSGIYDQAARSATSL
ncbi:MAG: winged helix DNA-binding protein [Hyphomicrobiales bacterium]